MKKLIFVSVMAIGISLIYKYVLSDDIPAALKQKIAGQSNPFIVPADSAVTVWKRALQLLEGRKGLLSGGKLVLTDSTIYLPYYNAEYRKGNAMLIESHPGKDSTLFRVSWWYSGKLQERGSKEVALFMEKGISRYGNHF